MERNIALSVRVPPYSVHGVVCALWEVVADCGASQKTAAKMIGISPQYLCDVLNGRRMPGKKLLKFFDLEAVTMYEPKRKP